ncbi:MAG TPA: pyridoxamine 5'-phosphate oxidase family protein [Sphingomicrobium sp.]|nr:pyridoxamine 5'-phosphate oxidase family protein [Sphingomicrobium sp.]
MIVDLTRRDLVNVAPAVWLATILGSSAARAASPPVPGELYRLDDEAKILAAAKAMFAEDRTATLVTVDAHGVPRVRPVGVKPPGDDLVFWIGTRRTSRKVAQIQANSNATLHFNFDDFANGYKDAFYVSFMGKATAHTDAETLSVNRPGEAVRKQLWPNFPDDFAAIRFEPRWLELYGKGVDAHEVNWQPQGLMLPAKA